MDNTATLKKNAANVMDNAQDVAENLKQQGEEMFDDAKEQGADLVSSAMENSQQILNTSVKWIKKNPALAAGAVIGLSVAVYFLITGDQE